MSEDTPVTVGGTLPAPGCWPPCEVESNTLLVDVLVHVLVLVDVLVRGLRGVLGTQRYAWDLAGGGTQQAMMYSLFPLSPFAVVPQGTPVFSPFCSLPGFGVLLRWCLPNCKYRAQAPDACMLGWHGSRQSRTPILVPPGGSMHPRPPRPQWYHKPCPTALSACSATRTLRALAARPAVALVLVLALVPVPVLALALVLVLVVLVLVLAVALVLVLVLVLLLLLVVVVVVVVVLLRLLLVLLVLVLAPAPAPAPAPALTTTTTAAAAATITTSSSSNSSINNRHSHSNNRKSSSDSTSTSSRTTATGRSPAMQSSSPRRAGRGAGAFLHHCGSAAADEIQRAVLLRDPQAPPGLL